MKIVLLLFLGFFTSVISFEFADPQEDGVFFISPSQNIQAINVNENNNQERFKFVLITGVVGSIDVNVNVGKEVLVVQTVDGDDDTEKYLTALRLDYDNLVDDNVQPRFTIDVIENGDIQNRKTISLTIINLDDEPPTLVVNNCAMKENTTIDINNSDCIFEISDRDGLLNQTDFTGITGTRGESDIFQFQYKVIPADDVRKSDVYLVLKEGQLLDYEKITLYTFSVEAKDGAGHPTYPSSIPIIVQVEDISDEPPKWNSFESAFTVPEESEFIINVSATDGDYGINNRIVYEVTDQSGYVTMDRDSGEITVAPIDRDADNIVKITFTVTAIEEPEPDSTVSGDIVLIIEDIDDNVAVLSVDGTNEKKIDTEVDEGETDLQINIQAIDIDLGENALYDVILESEGGTEFTSAISVIPNRGYEKMPLSLAVSKPASLDYEDPLWRTITMTLITVGNNKSMTDSLPITINLRDINDELPKFALDEYTARVREDVTQGYLIQTIKATDRDAEDADLKHEVLGTLANGIMEIEQFGGNITTRKDDAFDYEKLSELIVQVQATDAVGHQQTVQLNITVIDVNDENPRLAVSSTISVEENQINGAILDTQISASDEDTDADLEFTIDWTKSRATKNSRNLDPSIFDTIHCIKVETIPGDTVNSATAKLSIIETQPGNTPDYEVFDTLYIQLVVTDKNTDKNAKNGGTDSGLIAITIKDLNDNSPTFLPSEARRQVTENTGNGSLVTTVAAIDKDIGDIITYSIESDGDTPMWVDINTSTGDILVKLGENENIDCDEPQRYYLNYTVTANDGVHAIPTTISIYINDQNENSPQMGDQTKTIKEQAEGEDRDGDIVLSLNTFITDKDRDEPFHTVSCSFAATTDPDVTRRFHIDENNQIVVALTNGLTLDREVNPNGFIFTLNCIDDPTRQSPNSNPINPAPQITIILEDINDNKPTITNTDIRGTIDESSPIGPISVYLDGDDADAGDNGLVIFNEITKIQRFIDDNLQEDPPQDLISVSNGEGKNQGILTINKVLRDYYGDFVLTISLSDKGTPPLRQYIDVTLQVAKYNFEEPKYIFPADGDTVFLRYVQDSNAPLVWYNEVPLDNIKATDQQNGKFGITFKVVADSSGVNLFRVLNLADSQGQLQLTTTDFEKQRYTVIVTATIIADPLQIHGSASFNKNITFSIDFFDFGSTDPVFSTNQDSVVFDENQVEQTYQLPSAAYSIANLPDEIKSRVFYITRDDQAIFGVDSKTGKVTILQELDYEQTKSYTLVIYSSNSENLKQNPVDASKFTLTINVKDVNDNPPVFDSKNYVTTLTVETDSRATILQVTATDVDTTSLNKLRFSIASKDASTDILKQIPDPFKVDNNGNLQPNFTPKNSYKGFFTLQLLVRDEDDGDDHSDTAEVKIYLVTKDNIVTFTFENEQDAVLNSTDEIKTILDTNFASDHYLTHVENANQAPGDNQNPRTTCDVYFLNTDSNLPIEAAEIKKKVTDLNFFSQLKQAFIGVGLLLLSFVSESPTTENLEATLKAWLIGVSVVLGSLCLILLIAFILKTRALNQRINKLSNTKFGSQESGLNRTGVNAPTTNKHALEGSNPVYNNDAATKDIDRRISVTSGDSDLIGVEEDEKFDYNYYNKNEINGVE